MPPASPETNLRNYYYKASAMLNNIGTVHHCQNDPQVAMESYAESIRMRQHALAFDADDGEVIVAAQDIKVKSPEEMQAHLELLQQQQTTLPSGQTRHIPHHSPHSASTEQAIDKSRMIGLSHQSQPLQLGTKDEPSPAKSCLKGHGKKLQSEADIDGAITLFNVALLHMSQSNMDHARRVLELAIEMATPSSAEHRSSPPLQLFTMMAYNTFGYIAYHQNDLNNALSYFQEASSYALRVNSELEQQCRLGICSAQQKLRAKRAILSTLLNFARACEVAGLQEQAMQLCGVVEGLSVNFLDGDKGDECVQDDGNFDLSSILYVKACLHSNIQENEKALKLYQMFLRITLAKYGSDHPFVHAAMRGIMSVECQVLPAAAA